jgi:hypothetical protein
MRYTVQRWDSVDAITPQTATGDLMSAKAKCVDFSRKNPDVLFQVADDEGEVLYDAKNGKGEERDPVDG